MAEGYGDKEFPFHALLAPFADGFSTRGGRWALALLVATALALGGSGQLYLFWAPQALYLNVLDPIFMAVPFPAAHAAHRSIVSGAEPDVPCGMLPSLVKNRRAETDRSGQGDRVVRADPLRVNEERGRQCAAVAGK